MIPRRVTKEVDYTIALMPTTREKEIARIIEVKIQVHKQTHHRH
ncbi:hypothetical protein [Vulcanisaeta souniana]|nr:hypothetical protein [Vulcanisaeta souniana]